MENFQISSGVTNTSFIGGCVASICFKKYKYHLEIFILFYIMTKDKSKNVDKN
jgi:hypothetical protein